MDLFWKGYLQPWGLSAPTASINIEASLFLDQIQRPGGVNTIQSRPLPSRHPQDAKPPPFPHAEVKSNSIYVYFQILDSLNQIDWTCPFEYGQRVEGLWERTCFELFWKSPKTTPYGEFNLSPKGAWNLFSFSDYRQRTTLQTVGNWPVLDFRFASFPELGHSDRVPISRQFSWGLNLSHMSHSLQEDFSENKAWAFSLSAVVRLLDGTLTYWAAFPQPTKPDFHHPQCFQILLNEKANS